MTKGRLQGTQNAERKKNAFPYHRGASVECPVSPEEKKTRDEKGKRQKKIVIKSEADNGPRPQHNHIRLILQSPKNNPNKQIKDQINTSSTPTSKKNQSTRGGGAHGPPLLSRSHLGGPQYREAREPPHYGNRPQDANSDKVRQETWTPKGLFRRLARSKNRQRHQT